ncbi:MAG: response regulator [candidate division Zixibacteria bacterium]
MKRSRLANPIIQCEDGDQALDYLFRQNEYSDPSCSPRPGMILLDLNLPGTDGLEVLRQIKQDPILRKIPVIILTTSSDERDIQKCYDAGANSFVHKPVNLSSFVDAIQRLHDYWMEISLLPHIDS